jgi:hypothetical protein
MGAFCKNGISAGFFPAAGTMATGKPGARLAPRRDLSAALAPTTTNKVIHGISPPIPIMRRSAVIGTSVAAVAVSPTRGSCGTERHGGAP